MSEPIAAQTAYVILSLEREFASYTTDSPEASRVVTTTMDRITALCADEMPRMAQYISVIHDLYREPPTARHAFQYMASQQGGTTLTTDTHLLVLMSGEALNSDDIVGFTLFHLTPLHSINISQLFVCSAVRRKKHATLMLKTLIDEFGLTLRHIKADVPQTAAALMFFLASGFELARHGLTPSLKKFAQELAGEQKSSLFAHDAGALVQNRDNSLCLYYYPRHCRYCKKLSPTKRCTGCYKVSYCPEGKCQQIDYRMHKQVCKK